MTRPKKSNKRSERRVFIEGYEAEVVRLWAQPGKTLCGVARELGLTPSSLPTN